MEGLIPHIGVSNFIWHLVLVSEVCILDMLCQPILGVGNILSVYWGPDVPHGGDEGGVLVDMLIGFLSGLGGRLKEQLLFVGKMELIR